MTELKSNDKVNVYELVQKLVDQIKTPTEENAQILKDSMVDIEFALHSLKTLKPRQPKSNDLNNEKRPRGRPRVPYRAILENGKYDTRPKDPNYQKVYYLEKLQGVKVECPCCGVHTFKITLARQMKSAKCRCHTTEIKTDTD